MLRPATYRHRFIIVIAENVLRLIHSPTRPRNISYNGGRWAVVVIRVATETPGHTPHRRTPT